MNKDRRKTIDDAKKVVEEVQNEISSLAADEETDIQREDDEEDVTVRDTNVRIWQSKLENALEDLNVARDDEKSAFDNLSEGLQASDRGQNMEAAVSCLESACDDLRELTELEDPAEFNRMIHSKVDDIITNLEEAVGY